MDIFLKYLDFITYYVDNNFLLSAFIFFIFLVIYNSFSLPGNLFFFLSSGFFFNVYIGFLINILSIVIGSLNFFIFSKLFFKFFLSKFYNKYSNKITKIIKNSSYEYLILLRLISLFPLMVQNIFLSILNISKTKFIITTFIGFIPIMFLTAFIGNEISNFVELKYFKMKDLFSSNFLLIFLLLISIIILRIFFKKK